MQYVPRGTLGARGLLGLGVLLMLPACATVSQDDFDTAMADIRQEMRETEERLDTRMDDMEARTEERLDQLERALGELQDEFNVTVERMEAAIRFNAPVHFAFDDATVRSQDREVLERFAQVVEAYYDGALITVEGFTDPAGPAEYNRRLGLARAEAVMDELLGLGLSAERLRAVSFGEDPDRQVVPGAQGPGEEGWENRRVAMVIDFRPDGDERERVAERD